MRFSLIAEANLKANTSKDKMDVVLEAARLLNMDPVVLQESFRPTPEDYQTWLDVVIGYAKDQGVSLRRKNDFMDIAFAVLENDPTAPPYDVQEAIVAKLWSEYKDRKHTTAIDQAAQAQEEEERALDILTVGGEGSPIVDVDSAELSADVDPANIGDDEDLDDLDVDDTEIETCPNCGEEIVQHCGCEVREPELPDDDYGEETNRVAGAETIGQLADRILNKSTGYPDNFPNGEENEEAKKPASKFRPQSVLRDVISGPRNELTQELKGIEADGAAAWKAHSLPPNPHPEKSMAAKAWEKGIKNAALTHFGGTKPEIPKVKPKSKKK